MKPFLNFLFFTTIILFACKGKQESKRDEILRKFDSINQELEKISALADTSYKGLGGFKSIASLFPDKQSIYDSLELKFEGTDKYGPVRQMNYHVHDFCGYISDLKRRFYIACGDSSGTDLPETSIENISLTNDFFDTAPATYILTQLLEVKKSLAVNTQSDSIRNDIKRVGPLPGEQRSSYTAEYWRNKYFKDTPPVAVITILNSFERQVKDIEARILSEYLNQ